MRRDTKNAADLIHCPGILEKWKDAMPVWLLYIAIFLAKMVEVSLATLRYVYVGRGEKLLGACIGFVEVIIWVIVVSNVITSLTEDPLKAVFYCLGFACGTYLGVIIEDRLAIGTVCIQAMVPEENKDALSEALRGFGFGVTVISGEGKDGPTDILMIYLKRKSVQEAIDLIHSFGPNAMITVNDVRSLRNGFLRK